MTRHVLSRLGEMVGPVTWLYLFKVTGGIYTDGIFCALHLAHTLLTREFVFAVNQTEVKVFVRPTTAYDNEILDAASDMCRYNFDHRNIKVIKIAELSLALGRNDPLRNSPKL